MLAVAATSVNLLAMPQCQTAQQAPPNRATGLHRNTHARNIVSMGQHSHGSHDGHSHSHAGHSHSHGHGHEGHSHPQLRPAVLGWAIAATLGLVVAEIFGGLLGRSVALLNDAVHNLSDVPALGISFLAMRWAERPADAEKTYGYHRAGTLAAFTNSLVLVFLSIWLGWEAIARFSAPLSTWSKAG